MILIMIYYGRNRHSLNSKQAIKMLKATAEKVQKNVAYEKANRVGVLGRLSQ